MKVLAATLATLLLLATCSPSEQQSFNGVPTTCCFSYQANPIPRRLVSSVFVTSSSCIQPGVIVVTKKKRQLCVDPQAAWVKELQKHFQSMEN